MTKIEKDCENSNYTASYAKLKSIWNSIPAFSIDNITNTFNYILVDYGCVLVIL